MSKSVALALVIGGLILIAYGFGASNSFGSHVSRTFNGSPSGRSIWLLVGGAAAAVTGLAFMMRESEKP
jgi:Protein of unknown function (DUF3185)